MADEKTPPKAADALAIARERVTTGPVPSWVVACSFADDFKMPRPGPETHLLVNRQVHAEARQTHVHVAVRLETMEAVQRESQWRLEFEPRSQSIVLHGIKIRRGTASFDCTNLDKFHFLQREAGLERYVIQGWFTLLLVLEDVRPGDILEWCYTVEDRLTLLPDHRTDFFQAPPGVPIGKLHFSLRFNQARPMQWKSSSDDLSPIETRENDEICWTWSRENFVPPEPEPNTPEWHMTFPWIQVSDCPDWTTVGAAFAKAWNDHGDDPAVAEIARDIAASAPGLLDQVDQAIQLVQDEYRYLSDGRELGGQVPTPPGTVARRRYGDCKDLSFLLVHLLRKLGLPAQPVLVNTILRKSLSGMLPSPELFNHVVVEFQVEGEARWVDATSKRQGGGAMRRYIRDFGVGLPVELAGAGLVQPPLASIVPGFFELTETILVDTNGGPSQLAVLVTAKGSQADALRQEFASEGVEAVAKRRLETCAHRFSDAKRAGNLRHRDDRVANEFVLAEVFEINGFLGVDERARMCTVRIPQDIGIGILPKPNQATRHAPFALPHPFHVVHTFEVESTGLPQRRVESQSVGGHYVEFHRDETSLPGFCGVKYTLLTKADAVPADRMHEYRKTVQDIQTEAARVIRVPMGISRPHIKTSFGKIPWRPGDPDETPAPVARPVDPSPVVPAADAPPGTLPVAAPLAAGGLKPKTPEMRAAEKEAHRLRKRNKKLKLVLEIVWISVLVAVLVWAMILVIRRADQ